MTWVQLRDEGVVEGLQGRLLQVEISEIIVHEGDEPNAFADFLDAGGLLQRMASGRPRSRNRCSKAPNAVSSRVDSSASHMSRCARRDR